MVLSGSLKKNKKKGMKVKRRRRSMFGFVPHFNHCAYTRLLLEFPLPDLGAMYLIILLCSTKIVDIPFDQNANAETVHSE